MCNTCTRTFDPMKDQHPVSWLVKNLKNNLYPVLFEWVNEVLGETTLRPGDVFMPDTS